MKRFEIILLDDAIVDIQYAIDYYKTISSVLAKKFHIAVKNTFAELKGNPFYQVRYGNVRMRSVKGFPYILHFIVDENTTSVFVYGLRHSALNPDTSYFYI